VRATRPAGARATGMRIIHGLDEVAPTARGASAALGNFDGVHRGHQALVRMAARQGDPVGAITFEPHPRRIFQQHAPPFRLTTLAAKARILERDGVDLLFVLPFDRTMAGMEAEDFVHGVLVGALALSHVVVGQDFRFGKGRRGDAVMLRRMGHELGLGVTIHDLVGDESGEFASTAVRVMIEEGRCEDAARALGRWHAVTGAVVEGDRRGRALGYPTANLDFGEQLIPHYGVYAAWIDVLEGPCRGRHAGVVSVGERPTFGVNAPNFEAHLFDFDGDLYGAEIEVSLVRFLRGEAAYADAPALIAQMDRDSAQARDALATVAPPG